MSIPASFLVYKMDNRYRTTNLCWRRQRRRADLYGDVNVLVAQCVNNRIRYFTIKDGEHAPRTRANDFVAILCIKDHYSNDPICTSTFYIPCIHLKSSCIKILLVFIPGLVETQGVRTSSHGSDVMFRQALTPKPQQTWMLQAITCSISVYPHELSVYLRMECYFYVILSRSLHVSAV